MSSSSPDPEKLEPVISVTREDVTKKDLLHAASSTGKKVNFTGDVDDAMGLAVELNDQEYDPETDKKLLHKIDLFILPFFCVVYACQFADKVSNSAAAVMGLRQAYHMTGEMYSWVGGSFYLGYLLFVFPTSYLIQRLPLAKTTGAFIVVWGIILCLHSTPTTYAGFITLRVVLGSLESAITPSMMVFTSQWYRKEEQFIRSAFWFSCNGLGSIMGSAIGYGLSSRSNYSIAGWKLLFIIDGVMTIFIGIVFFLHIPDTPAKAWFLNDMEKKMVVLRIKANQQGFGNHHFKKYQFIEAMKDVQTWLFFLNTLTGNIPNGSLTNFGTILLHEDFGYSTRQTLLMNMPGGAFQFVCCTTIATFNKKFSRLGISIVCAMLSFICACLLAFGRSDGAQLAGLWVNNAFAIGMICALSCFSSNTAGHSKKVSANALYLIGYCAGNVIGPQTFVGSEAPGYHSGKITIVVCHLFSSFVFCAVYYVYWKRNHDRDRAKANGELVADLTQFENIEFADLTDKENPFFRYVL